MDLHEHGVPGRAWRDAATAGVQAELAAEIAAEHPDAIVIALGSVDAWNITYTAWSMETLSEAGAAIDTVLSAIASATPGVPIFLAAVPPQFDSPWARQSDIDAVNGLLSARVAADHWVDFATGFVKADTWDGLHYCGTTSDPLIHCTNGDHGQQLRADRAGAVLTH